MTQRVVITGMGIISPLGNDVDTFWNNLLQGKCGIGPIDRFDPAAFKVKLAAQVRDFDPLQYMDKNGGRPCRSLQPIRHGGGLPGHGSERRAGHGRPRSASACTWAPASAASAPS